MTDSSYSPHNSPEQEIIHQAGENRVLNTHAGVMKLVTADWVQEVFREQEARRLAQHQAIEQERRRQEALALSATADVELETSPTPTEPTDEQERAARLQEAQAATQRALGVPTDVSAEVSGEANVIQFPSVADQQLNTGVDHDQAAA